MDKTGSETQQIVLVDIYDRPAGYMEKMEAHEKGLLHRAVSVFLFNQHGEWMLQRLTEYEYDHIYIGHTSNLPQINPQEVAEWGYFTPGMGMCQNCHILFFYAQSPDFLKPGLCYFLKFMYLQA